MLYALLKTVHLLSIIVWLGGMFFTLFCLRHAVFLLPPAQRVPVMALALGRFFKAAGVAALLAVASGGWMIGGEVRTTHRTGAAFHVPLEWLVMAVLGGVMVLIFGHIRFALFKRLQRAEASQDWPAGAAALQSIRSWVAVNLVIGTVIVVVVMAGAMS